MAWNIDVFVLRKKMPRQLEGSIAQTPCGMDRHCAEQAAKYLVKAMQEEKNSEFESAFNNVQNAQALGVPVPSCYLEVLKKVTGERTMRALLVVFLFLFFFRRSRVDDVWVAFEHGENGSWTDAKCPARIRSLWRMSNPPCGV